MQWKHENYRITTDKSKLNLEMIHQFLTSSYWANERTREQIMISIENSLCFGVFEDKNQIGFARVITDYATFAYLADVFISISTGPQTADQRFQLPSV